MEILDLLGYSPDRIKVFILVLIRISLLVFLFPVYGSQMIPAPAKAAFALVMALVISPVSNVDPALFPESTVQVVIMVVAEVFIGALIGLTLRIFFAAVQLAGMVIGFQMGFTMINVVDPQSGENVSILEQIAYWVALLVFLTIGGHHAVILALVESFDLIQIGTLSLKGGFMQQVIALSSDIFILGIKIGSPVIAALLFTSAANGLTTKFAPQMNIMIVAFPLKIAVGLLMFGSTLKIAELVTKSYTREYKMLLLSLLQWMGGG